MSRASRYPDRADRPSGSRKPTTRAAIVEAELVAVSAASVWEIATKATAGKLRTPVPVDDLLDALGEWGLELLPITARHAWLGGSLPLHHRDPFDRMLVAQAQLEDMTVVTRDPAIAQYQVAVLAA